MITGIVSIPLVCCCYLLALPAGIAAAVMGGVAMSQASKSPETHGGTGMAIAGLVCGIIGAILAIIVIVLGFSGYMGRYYSPGGSSP
jgi:hypothetical protein